MRPELDDTLAAPASSPAHTATAPRRPAGDQLAPTSLPAGKQLGHFRIERPLGAGGMGEVYLATDLALDRPVAIKVLPEALARDPNRRDRMIREARAQARINHPNIGHIYFIGEEAGHLYFAMEYVAGETLTDRLAKGPLSVDDALAVIRSAALGLREAQRAGITHRDIKPSNLMIDSHGIVKVLDFGLAAGSLGDAAIDGPVAQTSFAGTPLYMAPEQARGEPVDHRTDIYALGATLYHLVAGRPPFEGDDVGTLLSKHASAERPAVPRRAGQPRIAIAAIDALCSRMMAPSPAQRFASYDELIRALELASVEHIRPAGLWVRAMATLVDLTVVAMVTGLLAVGYKLLLTDVNDNFGGPVMVAFVVFTIALTARNGRTLGQALFELEVVDVASGARPSMRAATLRTLIPAALPTIGEIGKFVLEIDGSRFPKLIDLLFSLSFLIGPIGLIWASLRSVSKQTIWDRVSKTVVRYRTRRSAAI